MDLIPLYKAILQSLDLQADDDGLISMNVMGDLHPAMVQGNRLVLPIDARLKAGNWDGLQAFHPISENISRGPSPVIKKLRSLVNLRLTQVTWALMRRLVEIAADSDYHAKLDPNEVEFLTLASDADERMVQNFDKVLEKVAPNGKHKLISVYLKRGGDIKGEKFNRLGVVSFPVTDEFDNKDHTIFGVKMRVRDHRAFKKLFEHIFPGAGMTESYSAGSNAMSAPYFYALLKAFANASRQLNKIVDRYSKHLEDADALRTPLDWEPHIENLASYRDLIPTLRGNDGELMVGDDDGSATDQEAARKNAAMGVLDDPGTTPAPAPQPAPTQQQPQQPQAPAWQPAPQPPQQPQPQAQPQQPAQQQPQQPSQQPQRQPQQGGGKSWSDFMGQRNAQQPQQPQPPQGYPPQQGYGYPPQPQQGYYPQQPIYPQQYPQQGQPQQGYQQPHPRQAGYQTQWQQPQQGYYQQPMHPGYQQNMQQPPMGGAQTWEQWQQMQNPVNGQYGPQGPGQWGPPQGGPMYTGR